MKYFIKLNTIIQAGISFSLLYKSVNFVFYHSIFLMKSIFILSLLFISINSKAQYYYKDILGTRETNDLLKTYKDNKIVSVDILSTDAGGQKSENFLLNQRLDYNTGLLKTISKSGNAEESVLITFFNNKGQVIKSVDSTSTMINVTSYEYNDNGSLHTVHSSATDTLKSINETEYHEFFYTTTGKPQKMIRTINGGKATEIKFILDEKGNVTEEQTIKNNVTTDFLYYYYNDKNLLTDIVRYNKKSKKLLPDYLFEYSEDGKVIQKITVPSNSSEYQIWRYQFDARGLKIKEAVFDREKQLIGRITYSYQVAQ